MPRVVRTSRGPTPANTVYIGRPSKWGNPFVIRKYEQWVRQQPHLLAALPELRGKDLACFCAPLPCHGDVLLRLANA